MAFNRENPVHFNSKEQVSTVTDQADDYVLDDFVRDMTMAVEQYNKDDKLVTEAERLVGKLVRGISWLPPEKQNPKAESYARHTLFVDPKNRFEVMALVWQPGQCTPLHDHDGTWGAEGVLVGRIKVTNFIQADVISVDVVRLFKTGTVIVNAQCTGQLLPPADCHILEVEGDQIAITIHVYGKQLRKFRVFEPLKEEGVYVVRDHFVDYSEV
ncbi:cysteine dioxygenase [Brevibacillus parabrevis]